MANLSDVRIIQPNLTCAYHLTQVPGNQMRSLIAINKDAGVGIADSQIPHVFWAWCLEYNAALKARKDLKMPEEIPDSSVYLQLNKSASVLNLNVITNHETIVLDDVIFLVCVQNWTASMAKALGVTLEIPSIYREKNPGLASTTFTLEK